MEDDRFYKDAAKFFTDMKLPYDRKKMFLLANMFADYTLQGAVNEQINVDALTRIKKLQEMVDDSK